MAWTHPLAAKTAAADKIAAIEAQIRELEAEAITLRKANSRSVENYQFVGADGEIVHLADLFDENDELIVVHNMGGSCAYCTMWADGYNGVLENIEERAAFAVASPDSVPAQKKLADKHGWKFTMVSNEGSSFAADFGFLDDDGQYFPGVSTFARDGDDIKLIASAPFGPGDKFCSVFSFFELLPAEE